MTAAGKGIGRGFAGEKPPRHAAVAVGESAPDKGGRRRDEQRGDVPPPVAAIRRWRGYRGSAVPGSRRWRFGIHPDEARGARRIAESNRSFMSVVYNVFRHAMTITDALQFVALFLLLAASGFCSSSETALFSLNPIDLRRLAGRNPALAARVRALLTEPTGLLSTVLILNTAVNIAASALAFRMALRWAPRHAESVTIPVMTALLLLFGEYGPKRAALLFTIPLTRLYTPALSILVPLLRPIRAALQAITRRFERHFRAAGKTLTGEELRTVIDLSGEAGLVDAEELAMVKAIIDLERMTAADVMTPRVELRGYDLNAGEEGLPKAALDAPVRYLVLYRGSPDEVEGFLDVRRYLLDPERRRSNALLPPYYVPETIPLNRLLAQFQRDRARVALVVDEYGGTAGVVTRGDILEEITGEVYGELSRPRPIFQEAGPHRWLVDPGFSLDDLNRKLRLNLCAEGADRLSGWIAHQLGRLPAPNDRVVAQGVRVTVLKMERARVTLAQIEKIPETEERS